MRILMLKTRISTSKVCSIGLKCSDFPKEAAAQNVKAGSMIHELIVKVLGREEPFNLSVRRGTGTLRLARDSTMYLVPPIEVKTI